MLFDLGPKTKPEDLYDRQRELSSLGGLLRDGGRLAIVQGVRRVGKTSLLNVFTAGSGIPGVMLDVRKLYFEAGAVTPSSFYRAVADAFSGARPQLERLGLSLKEMLARISGLRVGDVRVEFSPARVSPDVPRLLEDINGWCEERGTRFLLVLDEAQYLRFSGRTRFDAMIAWAVDALPNLIIALSGSEVGLLRDFLGLERYEAPLYGRPRAEVSVDRFDQDTALGFLEAGFGEVGIRVDGRDLEDVYGKVDGLVGWLTLYGHYRAREALDHREALELVFREGASMALGELERLIGGSRRRYMAILMAMASGLRRWSEVKAYVESKSGPIADNIFDGLLKNLVKYGVVERSDDGYGIADPVLRRAVLDARG